MGVSGLLNLFKSIQTPTHLRQFAGQTLGVDAYGWLHRGAVPCAVDLAQGKPSVKHVEFAMHRVRMLVHFGVIPFLVFDGDRLPSKAATEHDRAVRRAQSKNAGMELLRLGKIAQAHQELQKAVDITPEMAGQLIDELKRNKIQYIVAPYEADSQLAYLEQKGIIDGIISEDSDLLVFGAKTLLTKLDQFGECVMIRQRDYTACREVNLTGWTCADLRRMAILNGCDYLEGIHKMGLKTAYRLVRKCKTIERVVQCAQLEGKFRIPADYLQRFAQADMTFLYQWVYCPLTKTLVHLNPPESEDLLSGVTYIGQYVEPEIATGVAAGQLNPITKRPIVVEWPLDYRRPGLIPKRTGKENAIPSDKKIDSFFTPRPNRVPLAELDPNSLAPSESQRRLLQQNSARSWTPVPANARPVSAQPLRLALEEIQQPRNIMSAPHSHKRQRLCAEDVAPSADALFDAHEERSRFFTSQTPSALSVHPTKARAKKSKNADINIWSDDSIDDAMTNLPDFASRTSLPLEKSNVTKPDRTFTVFKDEQFSTKAAFVETEENIPAEHTDSKQLDAEVDHESPFTAGLLAQTEAFRQRYTLKTPPNDATATTMHKRVRSDAATQSTHPPVEPMTPPASHAAKCEPSDKTTPLETTATIAETPLANRNANDHTPSADSNPDAGHALEEPTRPKQQQQQQRILRPKGSEDLLLVPDSDAESGGSPTGTDGGCGDDASSPLRAPAQRLDVRKFAFSGSASVSAS